MKQLKEKNETSYQCPDCGKTFGSWFVLKRHYMVHTGEKPYACSKCDMRFSQAHGMRRHETRCNKQTTTRTKAKVKTCAGNEKLANKSGNPKVLVPLVKRIKVVDEASKKPKYVCPLCPMGFMHTHNLQKHLNFHASLIKGPVGTDKVENRHKCPLCGMTFGAVLDLQKHMSIHTAELEEGSHDCPFCSKKFTSKSAFSRHQRSHFLIEDTYPISEESGNIGADEKQVKTDKDAEPFTCCVCRQQFNSVLDICDHMQTHCSQDSQPCLTQQDDPDDDGDDEPDGDVDEDSNDSMPYLEEKGSPAVVAGGSVRGLTVQISPTDDDDGDDDDEAMPELTEPIRLNIAEVDEDEEALPCLTVDDEYDVQETKTEQKFLPRLRESDGCNAVLMDDNHNAMPCLTVQHSAEAESGMQTRNKESTANGTEKVGDRIDSARSDLTTDLMKLYCMDYIENEESQKCKKQATRNKPVNKKERNIFELANLMKDTGKGDPQHSTDKNHPVPNVQVHVLKTRNRTSHEQFKTSSGEQNGLTAQENNTTKDAASLETMELKKYCKQATGAVTSDHTKEDSCNVDTRSTANTVTKVKPMLLCGKIPVYYKCGLCNTLFASRALREQHMKIHLVKKLLKCMPCGDMFFDSASLLMHLKKNIQCAKELNKMLNPQLRIKAYSKEEKHTKSLGSPLLASARKSIVATQAKLPAGNACTEINTEKEVTESHAEVPSCSPKNNVTEDGRDSDEEATEQIDVETQTSDTEPMSADNETVTVELEGPVSADNEMVTVEQQEPVSADNETVTVEQEEPVSADNETSTGEQEEPVCVEDETSTGEQEEPVCVEDETGRVEQHEPVSADVETGRVRQQELVYTEDETCTVEQQESHSVLEPVCTINETEASTNPGEQEDSHSWLEPLCPTEVVECTEEKEQSNSGWEVCIDQDSSEEEVEMMDAEWELHLDDETDSTSTSAHIEDTQNDSVSDTYVDVNAEHMQHAFRICGDEVTVVSKATNDEADAKTNLPVIRSQLNIGGFGSFTTPYKDDPVDPSPVTSEHRCEGCKQWFSASDLSQHHGECYGNYPYQCSVCEMRFNQTDKLFFHSRTHTQEDYLKIQQQEIEVKRKQEIREAEIQEEQSEARKRLKGFDQLAKTDYVTNAESREVVNTNGEEMLHKCSICRKEITPSAGDIQLLSHEYKPLKCTECHDRFYKHRVDTKKPADTEATSQHDEGIQKLCDVYKHEEEQGIMRCVQCGAGFYELTDLSAHMEKHKEEKPKASPESKLRTPERYYCAGCGDHFKYVFILKAHMKAHCNEKSYKCPHCDAPFLSPAELSRHLLQHTGEKLYRCGLCKMKFFKSTELNQHVVLRHSGKEGGKKPYECARCERLFSSAGGVTIHLKSHIQGAQFKCSHCEQMFESKAELAVHNETHLELRPLTCYACNATFTRWVYLKGHVLKVHHNYQEQICPYCGYYCTDTKTINAHLRNHAAEKKSICSVCGEKFMHYQQLKKHLKKEHTAKKVFRCEHCICTFRKPAGLRTHMINLHKNIKQQAKYHGKVKTPGNANTDNKTETPGYDRDSKVKSSEPDRTETHLKAHATDRAGKKDKTQENEGSKKEVKPLYKDCSAIKVEKPDDDSQPKVKNPVSKVTTPQNHNKVKTSENRFTIENKDSDIKQVSKDTKSSGKPSRKVRTPGRCRLQCEDCQQKFIMRRKLNQHLRERQLRGGVCATPVPPPPGGVCATPVPPPPALNTHLEAHMGYSQCGACVMGFSQSVYLMKHLSLHADVL